MTHVFLNGLGANAGAGLTYLYNVVPRLASQGIQTTLALQSHLRREFQGFEKINLLDIPVPRGTLARFWFEQAKLPALIRESEADVLLSAGNFAIRRSPVPQILLSGNSLYTSKAFYRDLLRRREYRMWMATRVRGYFARKSVHWADCTVAPTKAFAGELGRWTGKHIEAVHHGFDENIFFSDDSPLPNGMRQKLTVAASCLKLLFVSHYNYYRNFETLFRGIAILRERMPKAQVRLFLTCMLADQQTPGAYKTNRAARLIQQLGIREEVVELGAVPYPLLHNVYRACDVYLTAAYAETFAHPLVEAMACGLPIVASDLPVHREVCGHSAEYFSRFSPTELADALLKQLQHEPGALKKSEHRFSWQNHVEEIVALAASISGDSHTVRATRCISPPPGSDQRELAHQEAQSGRAHLNASTYDECGGSGESFAS